MSQHSADMLEQQPTTIRLIVRWRTWIWAQQSTAIQLSSLPWIDNFGREVEKTVDLGFRIYGWLHDFTFMTHDSKYVPHYRTTPHGFQFQQIRKHVKKERMVQIVFPRTCNILRKIFPEVLYIIYYFAIFFLNFCKFKNMHKASDLWSVMYFAHCSLLTAHCSLLTAHCSLPHGRKKLQDSPS